MPYLFTCPNCRTKTQVEDRYSGQSGNCVTCGAPIHLPDFGEHSPAPPVSAQNDRRVVGWIAAALCSVLLVGSLLFAMVRFGGRTMSTLANNRDQTASIRNLEKIASALNAYAADHGTYPPQATMDSAGIPMHSWRVLILPYLGEDELYNQFNLDLPWNHAENQVAAYEIPAVYLHSGGINRGVYSESAYYLIVGPGTVFPSSGPLAPEDISDNPSQTILVTEAVPLVPSSSWTEPLDLDVTNIQGRLGTNPGIEPGGLLEDGVAIATADGRGHFVPDTIAPSVFRSLITPQGNERLADDTLD